MSRLPPRIRCREIEDGDISAIIELLLKSGLPGTRDGWARALQRLAAHAAPPGFPKYGFLLEVNRLPVGVVLLISSSIGGEGERRIRCNLSTWFVWPAFRNYAALLVSRALRYKDVTYINISPLPFTLPIIAAQGFTRYSAGRFLAVPALRGRSPRVEIALMTAAGEGCGGLPEAEIELLRRHVSGGCVGIIVTQGGRRYPFLFDPRRRYRVMPLAYLVYCPGIDDFVRFAGPIGRFLAKRGYPLVALDANGPVPGLIGWYSEGPPKYFKGPHRPRLGDLAYSEQVVLGVIA